ncbi:MAG TPA: hypothetical protein PLN69_08090 [bacterium]|nr:hypothetical protein [bacterium]
MHIELPIKQIVSYDPGPKEKIAIGIWTEVLGAESILLNNGKVPFVEKLHVDYHIPLKWNPYPPYLGEYNSNYHPPDYSSIVVLGSDNIKYQITIYFNAQTDSTPSITSSKVRGERTNWGDYYVRYLFVHDTAEVSDASDMKFYEASWHLIGSDGDDLIELFIAALILFAFQSLLVFVFFIGKCCKCKVNNNMTGE